MSRPKSRSKQAFADARQTFPHLDPAPPAGFALLDDARAVSITHASGQLVLANPTDLSRTIAYCQQAIDNLNALSAR